MAEAHDYFEPKLRVRASGLGGSGYRIPTRPEIGVVPGATTVLGILDKGGITQWAVDQTVAFCVTHVDDLLNRTEEQGFHFARYFHKRKPNFDDPKVDLHSVHNGVLDDLAELGTAVHDYIAADVTGLFEPDITRDEQVEMIEAWYRFKSEHTIESLATEVTVVGDGWAGTLDHIWVIDGVPTLVDVKTSRAVRETHYAQLGALGAAESMMVETTADDPDGVEYVTEKWGTTYWKEQPVPAFTQYAILQVRPDDVSNQGEFIPAFCELHIVPQEIIDSGWEMFQGALRARHGQANMKKAIKIHEKEGKA